MPHRRPYVVDCPSVDFCNGTKPKHEDMTMKKSKRAIDDMDRMEEPNPNTNSTQDEMAERRDNVTNLRDLPPVRIQKLLKHVRYPASRENLISYAQKQGADRVILEFLHNLPRMEYESMDSVMNHYYEANRHIDAV